MSTFLAAIIVLAAVGIVAWPLFRRTGSDDAPELLEDAEVSEVLTQKDATLFAINELESDYELGNLSHSDYQELRNKYEEKAFALIKTVDEMKGDSGFDEINLQEDEVFTTAPVSGRVMPTDEDIEARVLKFRRANSVANGRASCPGCGAKLVEGDMFCLRCGRPASSIKCPSCAAVVGADDIFCSHCGASLSAGGKSGKSSRG